MKIVMFSDAYWPRVNGVTVSVDSFSRALIKAGHEVLVICSFYPDAMNAPISLFGAPEEKGGPKIVRVPSIPSFITKEDRIAKFHKWFWVFKQVKSFDPDIIHINTEFIIAEFGYWYARAHNLPAIYTFHTMWEDYGPNYFSMFPSFLVKLVIRGILKNLLRRSYRVIVPTPQIDEVVRRYSPISETFLLPTGIDAKLFKYSKDKINTYREKLFDVFPLLKEKRLLLFAGRVVKEKNLGFLFKILPDIIAKHPDVVLLIAGDGPDQEYYKNMVKKANLDDNCVFTGYMERRELAMTYAISDVFVFPSLTDTQGLVTLESMLSGTPVVAIGALGTLMVMAGDNGGFMVNNDPEEFTSRVLDLLGNKELHRKKSLEAKAHARSWCIDELTKKLIGIYKSTIESYREDYGEPRTPVWGLMMDKRWWKVNNKYFQKKTREKLQQMRSKLKRQDKA